MLLRFRAPPRRDRCLFLTKMFCCSAGSADFTTPRSARSSVHARSSSSLLEDQRAGLVADKVALSLANGALEAEPLRLEEKKHTSVADNAGLEAEKAALVNETVALFGAEAQAARVGLERGREGQTGKRGREDGLEREGRRESGVGERGR